MFKNFAVLLLVFILGCVNAAEDANFKQNTDGIDLPPPKDTVTGFDLSRSPIKPGGTWGFSPDLGVVKDWIVNQCKKVKGKYNKAEFFAQLVVKYAWTLAESDEDLVKLKNCPGATWTAEEAEYYGAKTWKEAVKKLRNEKFLIYYDQIRKLNRKTLDDAAKDGGKLLLLPL